MSTNYINKITATNGTTYDIGEGVDTRIFRATCPTAAGTAAKVATLDDATGYTLAAGVRVAVTFTYGNSATTPTLNVNSGGAKNIVVPTAVSTLTSGNGTTYNTWGPYETIIFTYNGSQWVSSGSARSIYNAYALANSKGSGTITGVSVNGTSVATSGVANITSVPLSIISSADDLKAIEALTGTTGLLKKTAANTWALDTTAYTTNTGTVTSITLKAGTGIALDTDNTAITTSGTRTISHGDTSSQASSSNSGRTYIQSVTLDDYGHVTGLSTATETVTNTDTKLQVAAVTSGTTYYPIVGTGTTAATRQYDTTGLVYVGTNGTTSAVGTAKMTLGNSTASGTANNKQGQLVLYGSTAYATTVTPGAPTAARTITLPDKTGTVALTSDIPSTSDVNVTQTATTTSAAYEILFSATADNTTRTEGARKTSTLTYNPSTKALVTGGTINTYALNNVSTLHYAETEGSGAVLGISSGGTNAATAAQAILNLGIYPIGSVYMTTSSTVNPNTAFGGTWTLISGTQYSWERTA